MKKEDVITLPNPHLREKSARIREINDDTLKLIDNMTSAALDWEDSRPHEISAAIAAVQIDALERIVVVRSDFDNKSERDFTALINDYEGCLSVSHVYGKVPRYSRVRVKATNVDGEEVRFKADGFLARVLQHEIDHTNGIVFIDHIRDDHKAFYTLDDKGELQPLDYEEHVAGNTTLWAD
jgi:peptide deformylase